MIVLTGVESSLIEYCGVVFKVENKAKGFISTLVPMFGKADELTVTLKFADVAQPERRWIKVGRAFTILVREYARNGEEMCEYVGPPVFYKAEALNMTMVNWANSRRAQFVSGEHTKLGIL